MTRCGNTRTAANAIGCPTRKQLARALLVSARLTKRYKGTAFEDTSLDLFERMERELAKVEQRNAAGERADAILNACPTSAVGS